VRLWGKAWMLIKDTVNDFVNDNALSRGASIAYYTLFAIAPVVGARPNSSGCPPTAW